MIDFKLVKQTGVDPCLGSHIYKNFPNLKRMAFMRISSEEYFELKKSLEKKKNKTKRGFRYIGSEKFYFKSAWEANYARYLEFLKSQNQIAKWEYEPFTFWFEKIRRGTRSYLPDFKVTNNDKSHHWVEVKGYLDQKSKTKLNRMHIYYPDEKIMIVDQQWFAKNCPKLKNLILDWE